MLLDWVVESADTVSATTAASRSTRYTSRCRFPEATRSASARPLAGISPFVRVVVGEQVTADSPAQGLDHGARNGASGDGRPCPQRIAGGWRGCRPTWNRSRARSAAISARNSCGTDSTIVCRRDYRRTATAVSTRHRPGDAPTGVARCFACSPTSKSASSRNNRKSLQDALRGVLAEGYSMQASATPMQIFEPADRATGVAVLVPLYQTDESRPVSRRSRPACGANSASASRTTRSSTTMRRRSRTFAKPC